MPTYTIESKSGETHRITADEMNFDDKIFTFIRNGKLVAVVASAPGIIVIDESVNEQPFQRVVVDL
jgi:hypothetical protein